MAVLTLPGQARKFQMLINGQWTNGQSTNRVIRHSPGHGVPVSEFTKGTKADAQSAVNAARTAFDYGEWPRLSGADRAEVLQRVASGIRNRAEEIALVETLETGKPINQSRGEVLGAAGMWDYAAGQARSLNGESFNQLGSDLLGLVLRVPVGVVGVITPWNFPFFILCERLPFILASGCTAVIKPSELTSGSTLLLGEILIEAGIPSGVVNIITGSGSELGDVITHHEDVDMVSFTGSTPIGRRVLQASSTNMKKVGLELGGKNPHVVFADANLDDAADGVAFAVCFNGGQCCVSGSRLIVEKSIAEAFVTKLSHLLDNVRFGDPLDESTQVGAIIESGHFNKVKEYVETAKQQGITLAYDGRHIAEQCPVPEGGLFYFPKVFIDVPQDAAINLEEVFGPVITVSTFETEDEAIALANDSIFGLAASVWTKDLNKATRAMRRLDAGRIWVNTTIAGGPELPIGGMKQSGIGRETGRYGIEEYTEVKAVHIDTAPRARWLG